LAKQALEKGRVEGLNKESKRGEERGGMAVRSVAVADARVVGVEGAGKGKQGIGSPYGPGTKGLSWTGGKGR